MSSNPRVAFRLSTERQMLAAPAGKPLIVHVVVNVEHWQFGPAHAAHHHDAAPWPRRRSRCPQLQLVGVREPLRHAAPPRASRRPRRGRDGERQRRRHRRLPEPRQGDSRRRLGVHGTRHPPAHGGGGGERGGTHRFGAHQGRGFHRPAAPRLAGARPRGDLRDPGPPEGGGDRVRLRVGGSTICRAG